MRRPARGVRLEVAGTRRWVLSRCDKTSPRRAGGSTARGQGYALPPAPLRAARLLAARAVPPPGLPATFNRTLHQARRCQVDSSRSADGPSARSAGLPQCSRGQAVRAPSINFLESISCVPARPCPVFAAACSASGHDDCVSRPAECVSRVRDRALPLRGCVSRPRESVLPVRDFVSRLRAPGSRLGGFVSRVRGCVSSVRKCVSPVSQDISRPSRDRSRVCGCGSAIRNFVSRVRGCISAERDCASEGKGGRSPVEESGSGMDRNASGN